MHVIWPCSELLNHLHFKQPTAHPTRMQACTKLQRLILTPSRNVRGCGAGEGTVEGGAEAAISSAPRPSCSSSLRSGTASHHPSQSPDTWRLSRQQASTLLPGSRMPCNSHCSPTQGHGGNHTREFKKQTDKTQMFAAVATWKMDSFLFIS